MSIVNAWILWRRKTGEYLPLFDFKQCVAEHLCKVGKSVQKKRGRPSTLVNPSSNRTGTPTNGRVGTPTNADISPAKKVRKCSRRRQNFPLNAVRVDSVGHLPIWNESRMLCQNNCKFRSFISCRKCNTFLCLNKDRNCFLNFHL